MRGFFYSIIAFLLVTPLIMLTISELSSYETRSGSLTTKIIGDKLISYAKSIENDLPRSNSIMSKRALAQSIIYIETTGQPLNDSVSALRELMINGTIYGNGSSTDFTVSSWAAQIEAKGRQYGFETYVNVVNISFSEADSYNISAKTAILVNVSYPAAKMYLYRVYNATTIINLMDFNDPLYTLKTNGVIKRSIKPAPSNISGASSLDTAIAEGYYMQSQNGPSFLDRLEGRVTASGRYNTSASGLESVVYLPVLQANGFSINESQSDVDYLYFSGSSYPGYAVNQSAYSWLKIDTTHAAEYNLTLV